MTVTINMTVIISSYDQYFVAGGDAKDAMMIVIMNHGNAKDDGHAKDATMIVIIVVMVS